MTSSNEISSA